MNLYNTKVTKKEFDAAPQISRDDLAMLSRGWTVCFIMSIHVSESFDILAKITPNARLRKLLMQAKKRFKKGEVSLSKIFADAEYAIDPVFIELVSDGECRGELCTAFGVYSGICDSQNAEFAQRINWSPEVCKFTERMNFMLNCEIDLALALRTQVNMLKGSLPELQNIVTDLFLDGKSSLGVLLKKHAAHQFDPLYVAVIQAGEAAGDIKTAFDCLRAYSDS